MHVKIKKGLDIRIKGQATPKLGGLVESSLFAVKPIDFPGLTPKLTVKVGDKVEAGSPLFFDKNRPVVKFTSPVSGKVFSVTRGERRRILEVVVESDRKNSAVSFKKAAPESLNRKEIIDNLLNSGLWPMIRQRPFQIVADPEDTPKAIFISGFDSAPLAPDYNFILKEEAGSFQVGIDALAKLTEGKIHVGVKAGTLNDSIFSKIKGIEVSEFSGPHPAGNVGVQIYHIDPINKGEKVWVVGPQDVLTIGRLFLEGRYNPERMIALVGSEVKDPQYYKSFLGASIKNLVDKGVTKKELRFISGNVLTGSSISREGFLGYYDSLISVIPEGRFHEFIGWGLPRLNKFSAARSYFSWMMPKKKFVIDTNLHGGARAFVMTGEYEKVLPMDIYPVQLLKAILVEDIDLMEQLGIYEVAEEDMALCEFVCTSKMEVQSILRTGFDLMIKEFG